MRSEARSIIFFVLAVFGVSLCLMGGLFLVSNLNRLADERTISIFAWGDIFDQEFVRKFEEETGAKVLMSYYSSNEELLVKLKATQGEGYDLIIPSDYAVSELIQNDLLKKIEKEKIEAYQHINPLLLNHFFDPYNEYSIPFAWEVFVFGIDSHLKDQQKKFDWQDIFQPQPAIGKIIMVNDSREAISFAAWHLFKKNEPLNENEISQVHETLVNQKQYVEAYSNFRADYYLATKNSSLVLSSSSYILRGMKNYGHIDFVLPENGTFITIENITIPRATKKDDLVYKFINFMFRPEIVNHHFELFSFFPARIDGISKLQMPDEIRNLIISDRDTFSRYNFFRQIVSDKIRNQIWMSVK
jgi:spermidine/putrescine transport system substrate-binding protein